MGLLTKLTIVIASLAFTYASARPVPAQNQVKFVGRVEIHTTPIEFDPRIRRMPLRINFMPRLGPPCCSRSGGTCCDPDSITEAREFVSKIRDLGILIALRPGSVVVPEEISIEISSGDKKTLFFSTNVNCGGCGGKLSLKSEGGPTAYLATLDNDAVGAAEEHFVAGNLINVRFKVKNAKYAPNGVYLVNAKFVSR